MSDNYFEDKVLAYENKPYTILQKGNYAVISFEKTKGWDNTPFLFCKTEEGWKFDIVHQRKLIRMGQSSAWGIERYISPYSCILRKYPVYFGLDIPLEEKDIYKITNDTKLAQKIKEFEILYNSGKMSFEKALELGRLYSITALGTKALPILRKVKKKRPENPAVYKYMAIAYIDSAYQYESAQKEMKEYVKLLAEVEIGHNFLGDLFIQTEDFGKAEVEFQKALKINPESCYTSAKLSRVYDEFSNNNKFEEMFEKTKEFCKNRDYERFIWLIQDRKR